MALFLESSDTFFLFLGEHPEAMQLGRSNGDLCDFHLVLLSFVASWGIIPIAALP